MKEKQGGVAEAKQSSFDLRKLTKSGASRYLSVSTILPKDWIAVKVYVLEATEGSVTLKLVRIS